MLLQLKSKPILLHQFCIPHSIQKLHQNTNYPYIHIVKKYSLTHTKINVQKNKNILVWVLDTF